MPEVSIILPVFNSERFLEFTLESVFKQECQDFELIMVNDGSTDGTEMIVQKYKKKYSEIVKVFTHEQNKGLPAARNTGLRHVQGRFIALLDSDDLWEPEHLSLSLKYLVDHPGIGGCSSISLKFDDRTSQVLETIIPQITNNPKEDILFYRHPVVSCPSAFVFRQEALAKVGFFDEDLYYCEDWYYWLNFIKKFKIGCLAVPTVRYRWHENNLSKKLYITEKFSFFVIYKAKKEGFYDSETQFRKAKARLHLIYAGSHFHYSGNVKAVLKHSFYAFILNPSSFFAKAFDFVKKYFFPKP